MYLQVYDDYGIKYFKRELLQNSDTLSMEKQVWQGTTTWAVRAEGLDVEFLFDSEEAATGCYKFLKIFVGL